MNEFVISTNLGPMLHCFWDTGDLLVKNRKFSLPFFHFVPSIGVTPFEFLETLYRSWYQSFSRSWQWWRFRDPIACVFLIESRGVTDRQTDASAMTAHLR